MKSFISLFLFIIFVRAITPEQEQIVDELKDEQKRQVDWIADEQKKSNSLVRVLPGESSYASYFNKMMKVDKGKRKNNKKPKNPLKVQSMYSKPIERNLKKVGHVSDELNGNFYGRNGYNYEHTRKIKNGNMRGYSKSSVMYYTSSPEDRKNFGQLPGFFKNEEGDMWF